MFGFKQGTELSHREVFFLSTGLAVLTLACVLSHLDMEVDLKTKRFEAITESIPLALLTVSSIGHCVMHCLKYFSLHALAIVRSHVGWRGEQNIPYKGVETSP